MKKFEVHLLDNNPFRVPLPRSGKVIIDAENEEEVKEFFKDAKERDFPNIRGFHLGEIKEL